MKAKVTKKARTYNDWTLTITGLSAGKLKDFNIFLEKHLLTNPVGDEVSDALNSALKASKDYQRFVS